MNPEIEKQRVQDAEREAARARKRLQRQREKQAKTLYQRAENRGQFWAENRAALKPEELQDLERRQVEFVSLLAMVQDVIGRLNLPHAKIGPPDGLPFPDPLFEEVEEYIKQTGNSRIVHHADTHEFFNIHKPDDQKIRELFYAMDPEWYEFGIYTRFTHQTLQDFVLAVASYIDKHGDNPDFDFEPGIAEKVRMMRRGHTPIPTKQTHDSTVDNGEAFLADVEKQYRAAERQNSNELLKAHRDMAKEPINPLNRVF